MVDGDDNALCVEATARALSTKNVDLMTDLQLRDSDPGGQGAVVKESDLEYIRNVIDRDTAVAAGGEQC